MLSLRDQSAALRFLPTRTPAAWAPPPGVGHPGTSFPTRLLTSFCTTKSLRGGEKLHFRWQCLWLLAGHPASHLRPEMGPADVAVSGFPCLGGCSPGPTPSSPSLRENQDQHELFLLDPGLQHNFPPSHLVLRAMVSIWVVVYFKLSGLQGQGRMVFLTVSSGPGLPGSSSV